jgi:peptidoglycan/xylan/chitin deacetylase (PgdA/CDA1 family)
MPLLTTLRVLHLPAVFFVSGNRVRGHAKVLRAEAAGGFVIGNRTWDGQSFTGASTNTVPLTDGQIKTELTQTTQITEAARVPRPTLWQPPFGDVSAHANTVAAQLGYRIVLSVGSNIVNSGDWSGISVAQIVRNVTQGYTAGGVFHPGIKAGSIIDMTDGSPHSASTIKALPGIVAWMNAHHLGATDTVRPDATGGIVPNIQAGG